jgi:hypothetical protein
MVSRLTFEGRETHLRLSFIFIFAPLLSTILINFSWAAQTVSLPKGTGSQEDLIFVDLHA